MALEALELCNVACVNDPNGLVLAGADFVVPVAFQILQTGLDNILHHLGAEVDGHHVVKVLLCQLGLSIGASHNIVQLLHAADSGDVNFHAFQVSLDCLGSACLKVIENAEGHLVVHGVDEQLAAVVLCLCNDFLELLLDVVVCAVSGPVADYSVAGEDSVQIGLLPNLSGLVGAGLLVGVLDLATQELLKAFLTAGANGTIVAVENNNSVAGLHAVLLQPVCNTCAALPVVTGCVEDSVLLGCLDDTVEGDEGDAFCVEGFLTCLCRVVDSHHNDLNSVTVCDDGVDLVDLLFTGRSGQVNCLVLAGSGDLLTLCLCVCTGLCGPAVVGSGAHYIKGGAFLCLGLCTACAQSENHGQCQNDCQKLFHLVFLQI